jgi:hypothetical protein
MVNRLPQHTIVLTPIDVTQENVALSIDPLAIMSNTAREARAVHINRLTKDLGKPSRSPWSSDAEKAGSLVLLCFVDDAKTAFVF